MCGKSCAGAPDRAQEERGPRQDGPARHHGGGAAGRVSGAQEAEVDAAATATAGDGVDHRHGG